MAITLQTTLEELNTESIQALPCGHKKSVKINFQECRDVRQVHVFAESLPGVTVFHKNSHTE